MTTPNIVQKIEALHERLERARILVQEDKVSPVLGIDEHYIVESSNGAGSYLVNGTCSCWDAKDERRYELTKGVCKHRLATVLYIEQQAINEGESNGNDNTDADEGNTDDKPKSRRGAKRDSSAS